MDTIIYKIDIKLFFFILFSFFLVVLPLSPQIVGFDKLFESDTILFGYILLGMFYTLSVINSFTLRRRVIPMAFVFFLLLLISSVFSYGSLNIVAILSLVLILLFIPFIYWLIDLFGFKTVSYLLIGVLLMHAQWGVLQFSLQRDLRFNVLGERFIQADVGGVAKFSVPFLVASASGNLFNKIIRPNGPYAHSNSFAGVMSVGLLLALIVWSKQKILKVNFLHYIYSGVFLLSILLSFSRTSYISSALSVIIFYLVYKLIARSNSRQWYRLGLLVATLIIVVSPFLVARVSDVDDRAVPDRLAGYSWSIGMLSEAGVFAGTGIGASPEALRDWLEASNSQFDFWQIDFAHSVPLVSLVEWGTMTTIIALVLLLWSIRKVLLQYWYWLIPLIPLLMLDHYLVTQPAPLLVMVLFFVLLSKSAEAEWIDQ